MAAVVIGALGAHVFQRAGSDRARRSVEPLLPGSGPVAQEEAVLDRAGASEIITRAQRARAAMDEAASMAARGMDAEAVARLMRELEASPTHLGLQKALATRLVAAGEYEQAAPRVARALAAAPDDPDLRLLAGRLLLESGQTEAAYAVARWALETQSGDVGVLRLAARTALEVGEVAVAVGHLRRVLDHRAEDPEARRMMVVALLRRGEAGRAIHLLQELIRQGAAESTDYFNLAVAYALRGQLTDVLDVLTQASAALGPETVHRWLQASEFEAMRSDARFRGLEREFARNLSGTPTALMPRLTEPDRAVGLMPEPTFMERPIDLRAN